jgi:hypothetical protein
MRLALALLIAATAAAAAPEPASAQMQTPRQMLESMGLAPSERRVRRAVERAADEPLGSERNPVRVSSPDGQRAYMARLRCADGNPPEVGPRRNAGEGPFGTIIDVYPLDCGDSAPGQVQLAMDMYHDDHVETNAPAGFTLVAAEPDAEPK